MGELLVPLLTKEALAGAAIGAGAGAATTAIMRKPKAVKAPTLPKVEAPTVSEITRQTEEAGEAERKAARRRRGFKETIITGALQPETTKKTLLG